MVDLTGAAPGIARRQGRLVGARFGILNANLPGNLTVNVAARAESDKMQRSATVYGCGPPMEFNLVQTIAIYALPVIFAITLHEAAHGYVARHFGDNTAYVLGRVSLNPLRHIDPVGTILVPLLILVTSKLFGGAGNPVRLGQAGAGGFSALRHPKRDMLWVAAAGPFANLLMALLLGARAQVRADRAARIPLPCR